MTQYEKALKIFPNDRVTASKKIKHFCPSDLIYPYKDCCGGNAKKEKCEKCWNIEI